MKHILVRTAALFLVAVFLLSGCPVSVCHEHECRNTVCACPEKDCPHARCGVCEALEACRSLFAGAWAGAACVLAGMACISSVFRQDLRSAGAFAMTPVRLHTMLLC